MSLKFLALSALLAGFLHFGGVTPDPIKGSLDRATVKHVSVPAEPVCDGERS